MSDVISLGGFFLGRGTMLVNFHSIGTWPSHSDALNMAAKGSASHSENSRRNQFGNSSGPHDLHTGITDLNLY